MNQWFFGGEFVKYIWEKTQCNFYYQKNLMLLQDEFFTNG